jgi:rod shape-determining protein MreC
MPAVKLWNKLISPVIVIGAIIFISFFSPTRNFFGRLAGYLISPIYQSGRWISDQINRPSYNRLLVERDQLKQSVEDLSSRINELNQLVDIKQNFESLNDYSNLTKHQIIKAAVTSTSPDLGVKSITINRGQRDGVNTGQAAVTDHGILVGKVVAATVDTSTVLLLIDRQSLFNAHIQNEAGSPGLVRGERGLSLQMDYIPKGDSVKTGQTVVTNGNDPGIPPDILIGTVNKTSFNVGDLFQSATILPTAQFGNLRVVGIIIS